MIVREIACFKSTLPEDIIETEDGSGFVQPPGKSVADALADIVRRLDYEIYYGPEPAGDFVWQLGIRKAGRSFGAGLNLVDDYFLTFKIFSWTDRFLGRRPAVYLNLLLRLSRELAADPRFSEVRWFARGEDVYGMPGAPVPVDGGRRAGERKR